MTVAPLFIPWSSLRYSVFCDRMCGVLCVRRCGKPDTHLFALLAAAQADPSITVAREPMHPASRQTWN